jgi:tetratricopeptide (TPR) repeat protein
MIRRVFGSAHAVSLRQLRTATHLVRLPMSRYVHHTAPSMPETMVWDRLEHDSDKLGDEELQRLNDEGNRTLALMFLVMLLLTRILMLGFIQQYKDSEAAVRFAKILEREPTNIGLLRKQAITICTLPGRYDEANRLATKAISLFGPLSAELWDAKGFVLRAGGKYEEALPCLDRAIQISPQFAQAHWNKALCLNSLRRFGPAVLSFDRAIELLPDVPEIDYGRGRALFFLGKEDEAFRWMTDARLVQAGAREPFYRALKAYRAKTYEEALGHLSRASVGQNLNSEDLSDVHSWRGECALALGATEDGLKHFESALAINPKDPLSLHGRGTALLALSRIPADQVQKECFDEALRLDPIYYKSDYFRLKEPKYR